MNYDDWRVTGKPQSTQFLDYQVVNSDIEAERDHLRVGDHIVRVLTMKEAVTETRPLVLDAVEDPRQLLCGHRVDTAPRGQGPQRSEQAPPPLQYVQNGVSLPDGQRCHEDEPPRRARGRIQTGRH
jgi:hypothetical protein